MLKKKFKLNVRLGNQQDEIIKVIREYAEVTIPTAVNKMDDNNPITIDQYMKNYRIRLNSMLLNALLGASGIGCNKKIKFNQKLMNVDGVNQLSEIMENFVNKFEVPLFNKIGAIENGINVEDVSKVIILDKDTDVSNEGIPDLTKVSNHIVRDIINGTGDAKTQIIRNIITGQDVVKIAAIGHKLRKRNNRNRLFIIGGIVLAVAAGATVAYVLTRNSDDPEKEILDNTEDEVDMDTIEDEEIPEDSPSEEDVPVVDFE